MRLFVAVELPEFMRERLDLLLSRLKRELTGPRWARAEGIHLTLRFLGEINEADLPGLRAALCSISGGAGQRCEVKVEGLGLFPERGRPRVLWIGLHEKTGALAALQLRVESAVREAGLPGYKTEERSFHPHLTLARFGETKPSIPIRKFVESKRAESLGAFEISSVALYQRLLAPGGARYNIIQEYSL